jgi:CubicO group peptidase (beta-lactamase class C family)
MSTSSRAGFPARLAAGFLALACVAPSLAAADAATGPHALTTPDAEAWLDGFMPNALRQGDIAGAVVAIVKDGAVVVEKGYGYADVATESPMDGRRTLVRPGSISKLFTWTAVMQLVEQGKIDLDADVNGYLDFRIPDRDDGPVTVRHLMTHTAGFEEQLKNLIGEEGQDVPYFAVLLKDTVPERIFPVGTTPAYSNYATSLAGYIVERVSGMPFDDYLEKYIFTPLGMTSSTFRQPLPEAWKARMSKGYPAASKPAEAFEIIGAAPAGSMTTTASDMARFMIAHLQKGQYGENRILGAATAEQMHDTALTILPHVNRMLLGFYESNYKGRRAIAHGGDTQWFHSDLQLFVDDGAGVFVSVNSAGREGAAHGLRAALVEEFADRYLPVSSPKPKAVDDKTAREHAALIAGGYVNSRRPETSFLSLLNMAGEVKVVDNGDGTIGVSLLKSPSGVPFRWRETGPFVWQQEHGTDVLVADVKDGRVTRFTVGLFSPFMMFERPAPLKAGTWLLPAAAVALLALFATALAWPVSALVRRHYRVPYALRDRDARAHRWVRLASTATVVLWGAWAGTIIAMMSDFSLFSPKTDPWLWVLNVLTPIVCIGGALIGLWYAVVTWRSRRRRVAKVWAVVLALALLVSLWVAIAFNVIGTGVKY